MDYEEGDLYSAIIPEGSTGVIFNNGSGGDGNQTKDLSVPFEPNNYFVNDNLQGNWIENPNAPSDDQPGADQPGADEPAKEMTWLQKIAKAILLFLRRMEEMFLNMFKPAAPQQ
jgi:hypothetical protein